MGRDITYVRTRAGWLYAAVVVDAFSRAVGRSMRDDLRAELVVDAIGMALSRRDVAGGELVHYPDRAPSARALPAGAPCARRASPSRWDRARGAYDNVLAEAFMATLESEVVDRRSPPTRQAAHTATYEYIEGWHNPRRLHSALG